MASPDAFLDLVIALGLGLLVGLQRERAEAPLAGIRTFPLITVLGAASAMVGLELGGWIPAAALVGVIVAFAVGAVVHAQRGEYEHGITTAVATLLMFLVGAMLPVMESRWPAVAIGGGVAVLLHLKRALHAFAEALGDEDIRAIMQFAVVTLIVLPVLPDRAYGPYDVLNPRNIWLMVALVVGISLGAYIVYKFVGGRAGAVLWGVLGGAISSTATTISVARRAKEVRRGVLLSSVVLLLATTMMHARVLVEIGVVAPGFFGEAWAPIAIVGGLPLLFAAIYWIGASREGSEMPPQGNPSELKTALIFAAVYAGILLLSAWARDQIGPGGLYGIAMVGGLTDMDAITLSTARLVNEGRVRPEVAWRAIVIASLSNLVFKSAAILLIAGWRSLAPFALAALAVGAAGGALLIWW